MAYRKQKLFSGLLLALSIIGFQNCDRASFNIHNATAAAVSGGNDQGYGGKVYAHIAICNGVSSQIGSQMQLSNDGKSAHITVENCQLVDETTSDFAILADGTLSHAGMVYVEASSSTPDPAVVQQAELSTFITVQFNNSLQRSPSGWEMQQFVADYNPSAGQGCQWIASTLIRGQESKTYQVSLAPSDRAAFVIHALLNRTATSAEITQWTETATNTWQQIYDEILATPEFQARCPSYGLQ